MLSKKLKFRIGADPEIIMETNGTRLSASAMHDVTKCKTRIQAGQIGDDAGDIIELRPKAEYHVSKLIKNFRSLFEHMGKKLSQFEWKTTSFLAPAGGHIHVEFPTEFTKPDYFVNIKPNETLAQEYTACESKPPKLLHLIHQYLAFYLPIRISENLESQKARKGKYGYGKVQDFRYDRHPNKNGSSSYALELRAPSTEWLTTPKVMRAILAYIACIHNQFLYHKDPLVQFPELKTDVPRLVDYLEDWPHHPIFVKKNMTNIMKAIKTFELYPTFRKEIKFLFNTKAMIEEKEKANYDISKGWNLESPEPSLEDLTNQDKTAELLKKINQGYIEQSDFPVLTFNDDYRITELAQELTKRIFAFKWRLKNKYVLFGLRKEQKELTVCNSKLDVLIGSTELTNNTDLRNLTHTTFKKMYERFQQKDAFYIGIPYELRKGKRALNRFLDIIHFLENKLSSNKEKLTIVTNLSSADYITNLEKERTKECVESFSPNHSTTTFQ
ncbi:hypothetical protein M0R04_06555 [Candidatus Dojkabacteria bacterium]|jgi:hypothetical protein|nr:hypothetical protein [Candidatus Dojkabacteria bacterium]